LHDKIKTSHEDIKYLLSKKINGFLKATFLKPSTFKELNIMKGLL